MRDTASELRRITLPRTFGRIKVTEDVPEREAITLGGYRTLEEITAFLEAHGLAPDGMIAASPDD
jgi:hypothetical protein